MIPPAPAPGPLRGLPRQIAVLAATLLMLALNLGPDAAPTDLASQASQGMYARYPNAFAPHPFTFSIWLPIFLGAIASAVHQAAPSRRADPLLDRIGTALAAAYTLVGLTVPAGLGVSNVVVALATAAAAAALRAARPLDHGVPRWAMRAPAGLLTGWLLAATLLNLCQLLTRLGVPITAPRAAVLMAAAALAGRCLVRLSREPTLALALLWALLGIVAAHPEEGAIWAGAGLGFLILGSGI